MVGRRPGQRGRKSHRVICQVFTRPRPRGDHRQVTETLIILALVVVTALGFDFTNGFHDTANAMATSISTQALRPKVAVALSGILNLIGAFLSVEVALTVTN